MKPIVFEDNQQFWYEPLRAFDHIAHGGADFGEVLVTARKIKSGDNDSWYNEWVTRAPGPVNRYLRRSPGRAGWRGRGFAWSACLGHAGGPALPAWLLRVGQMSAAAIQASSSEAEMQTVQASEFASSR